MTTSVITAEEIRKLISLEFPDKAVPVGEKPPSTAKPISGKELIERMDRLFTPEEAETLARHVEEARAEVND